MKLTTKILLAMLLLFTLGLFASNVLLKKEYDKTDKNDIYWTYGKILEQPFKYLNIEGGNVTNIAYEQSKTASVRVFKDWEGYKSGAVRAHVKNDTLFITFPNTYKDQYEKRWLNWNTLVRIFSPELLAVNGVDTKFEMFRLKQNNIITNKRGIGYFTEPDAMESILSFRREQFMENELPVFLRNLFLLKIDIKEIKAQYEQFVKDNFSK